MNKTRKISGLLLALLFAWGSANAAGLGKLTVQSALGQPLKAEIELLSVTKDDLADITAKLASADAFRQARIDRQDVLSALRFSVDQRANGQPIIRITSTSSVPDPFLDMLIELNWSSGRLVREYTILLDPPASAKPIETVRPAAVAEAPRNGVAKPAVQTAPVAAAESVKSKPVPVPVPVAPRRYGPVKSGETLRAIAGKLKPAEISLEQMMVGLYQANKDAFQSNNMSRLNRGRVLNVPEADKILQVSRTEAARTVHGHAAEWHAYRRKLAEIADEAPPPMVAEQAAGKIAPKEEGKPAPAPTAPKDVLKLSKGEPGAMGKADAKTQERMHAMEEELAAKGRSLQEAQERVSQLERTVRDMQKLLEMKAQEAAKAPPAPIAPPAAVAEMPAVAPEAPAAPTAPPKPAPVVADLPEAEPSTSWVSTFISNPIYIGGIVAALLLSALLWMMMVGSRRRQGLTKFEDSIMTGGEFKNNAVFNASSGNAASGAATEGSMLLTDFSRLGMGAIDSHEVDPIAEAEVYMAYGRDAQAEEILREALGKDPSRHEIALKLLELYASRKDTTSFETTASDLYAGLGGQSTPVWERAAEMGRSIDPQNPLYRVATPLASSMAAPAAAMATAAAMASVAAYAPAKAAAPAAPVAAEEDDLDQLASMNDWGDTPSASDADLSDDFETRQDVAPEHDNLMEFESATAFAEPAQLDINPPEPAATDFAPELDFIPSEELDLPPEQPAAAPVAAEPEQADEMVDDFGSTFDLHDAFAEPAPEAEVQTADAQIEPAMAEPEEALFDQDFSADMAADESEDMPVLDLSGIDLDLDADNVPDVESLAADEMQEIVAEPVIEMATDFDPFAEVSAPADFEPSLETSPEPTAEPAASAVSEAPLEAAAIEEAGIDPELREEVNTKLDLARAYMEMGDREGAREILQEVLGEGDAGQKAEATKLMAEAA